MKKFLTLLIFLLCFSSSLYSNVLEYNNKNNSSDLLKDFSILRERLKKNPKDIAALNSLGIIYARTDKLEDAVKIWQFALSIDPTYVHLYNNLGSAYKQLRQYDQARLTYSAGLIYSNSYWIYYNLGILEKETGNYAAAADAFKKCLQICPDFMPAEEHLISLGYNSSLKATPDMIKPPVGGIPTDMRSRNGKLAKSFGGKNKNKTIRTPKHFNPLSLEECIQIVGSHKTSGDNKYVALTFDDGPHSIHTPALLKILKEENVKASFFVVGNRAETFPEIITAEAEAGHEIGNHSWDHRSFMKISASEAKLSIEKTNEQIYGLTGKPCKAIRPPYGATGKAMRKIFRGYGLHEVLWDIDSRDWESKNKDAVVWRVMKNFSPGSIILMHDIHPYAIEAISTIIAALKANGYEFLTVSEMIERHEQQHTRIQGRSVNPSEETKQ